MSDDDYTNNRYFDKISYFDPFLLIGNTEVKTNQPKQTEPEQSELPELTETDAIGKYKKDLDTFIYQGYDFDNYYVLEKVEKNKNYTLESTRIRDSWINQITDLNTYFGYEQNCFFEYEEKINNLLYHFGYYKLKNEEIHCYYTTDIENLETNNLEGKYIITFTEEDEEDKEDKEDEDSKEWSDLSNDFSIFLKYTRGCANFNKRNTYRFKTNLDLNDLKKSIRSNGETKEETKLTKTNIRNYIAPKNTNNLMKSLVVYIYNDEMYKLNNTGDNIEVKRNEDDFTIKFRHRAPGGGVTKGIDPNDILIFMPFFSDYPRWVKFNTDLFKPDEKNVITIVNEKLNKNEFHSKYFTIIDPPRREEAILDVMFYFYGSKDQFKSEVKKYFKQKKFKFIREGGNHYTPTTTFKLTDFIGYVGAIKLEVEGNTTKITTKKFLKNFTNWFLKKFKHWFLIFDVFLNSTYSYTGYEAKRLKDTDHMMGVQIAGYLNSSEFDENHLIIHFMLFLLKLEYKAVDIMLDESKDESKDKYKKECDICTCKINILNNYQHIFSKNPMELLDTISTTQVIIRYFKKHCRNK